MELTKLFIGHSTKNSIQEAKHQNFIYYSNCLRKLI
uniref:Uncharacterized protein n=1 Tax=Setaria italica TaxID=4555 RepID=K3Z1U9_SETIT